MRIWFPFCAVLFCGLLAHADEVVRISIDPKKPEGLCFSKTETPKASTLCYFVGEKIETTKAITDAERATFLKDMTTHLPKPSTNRVCSMPVKVDSIDAKSARVTTSYCLEETSSKQRLKFRAWYLKTQALLGDQTQKRK